MVNITFESEKTCPVCSKSFTVTRVRSRLHLVKQDTDFYSYYEEINPIYFSVWVCPHCGYAAQDSYFETLPYELAKKVGTFLKGKEVRVDFSGNRTWEQAVATYKLAIFYADMLHLSASRLAFLSHKLAWLYREKDKQTEEQVLLSKACDYYEEALYKERFPIGNLTEVTLIYLIGELLRRIGKYEESLKYFVKVTSHPLAKSEKRILQLAKDAWHDTRELKKASTNPAG